MMSDAEFRSQVIADLAEIKATMRGCGRRCDEHHATLYGNGKEGLKDQVSKLWTVVATLKWIIGIGVSGACAIAYWMARR